MTAPSRKGYRAAVEYVATRIDPQSRDAGVDFLAWFYNRDKVLVAGHVEAVQLTHDEAVINPKDPSQNAKTVSARLCATPADRADALRFVDGRVSYYVGLSDDPRAHESVLFWRAVRRLVNHRLTWRIVP